MKTGDLVQKIDFKKDFNHSIRIGIVIDEASIGGRWIILWQNGNVEDWFSDSILVISESR